MRAKTICPIRCVRLSYLAPTSLLLAAPLLAQQVGGASQLRLQADAISELGSHGPRIRSSDANGGATEGDRAEYADIRQRMRSLRDLQISAQKVKIESDYADVDRDSPLWQLDIAMRNASSKALATEYAARTEALHLAESGPVAARIEAVRAWVITAYYYAYDALDSGNRKAAGEILERMTENLQPWLVKTPPELGISIIRYRQARYFYALFSNDKAASDSENKAIEDLVKTNYTHKYDFLLHLRFRLVERWAAAKTVSEKSQICREFQLLITLQPRDGKAWEGLTKCQVAIAQQLSGSGQRKEAMASLEIALEDLKAARDEFHLDSVEFLLNEVALLNALASNEQDPPLALGAQAYKKMAAERFVAILSGQAFWTGNAFDVRNLYSSFADMEDEAFGRDLDPAAIRSRRLDLFRRLGGAVEASRSAHPTTSGYAYVAIDSRNKIIDLLRNAGDTSGALAESDAALPVVSTSSIVANATEYDGDGEVECSYYSRRIQLQINAGRLSDAEQTLSAMDRTCGAWARKYPWDFYVRSPMVSASFAIGQARYLAKRFAEAAPLLSYASDWGNSEASFLLDDMYRYGRGLPADTVQADRLRGLATTQTTKRFTVPTNFDGVKFPFYIYITTYARTDCTISDTPVDKPCVGFNGIDDQIQWVLKARGGEVPADVAESFRKLNDIATKNNVSFPALAVYALGLNDEPSLSQFTGTEEEKAAALKREQAKREAALKELAARPAADLPISDADPVDLKTEFFFRDLRSTRDDLIEARVVPLLPSVGCAEWHMHFKPEPRRIKIHIGYSVLSDGAGADAPPIRSDAYEEIVPLNTGSVEKRWCFNDKSPAGRYRIRVTRSNSSMVSFDFLTRPMSEFPGYVPPGKLVADPETVQAAESIAKAITASHFRRNPRVWTDPGGIALLGYDPVSLADGKPAFGKPALYALWNGGVWLFDTEANRKAFLGRPDRFVPELGGSRPFFAADGTIDYAEDIVPSIIDGKLYLAGSVAERDRWAADSAKLLPLAQERWLRHDDDLETIFTRLGREVIARVAVRSIDVQSREVMRLARRSTLVDLARTMPDNAKALASALGNRSWTLILLHRPEKALRDIDEALRLAPGETWIAINRADALVEQRKFAEAIAAYNLLAGKDVFGGKAKGCDSIRSDLKEMLDRHVIDNTVLARLTAEVSCLKGSGLPPAR